MLALGGAALFGATSSFALAQGLEDKVVIITSFSKDVTGPFASAFEKKYPGTKVEVQNRNTNAAVAFVRETPSKPPDIFWASAPDAFEVLAEAQAARRSSTCRTQGIPAKIGSYPINDPEGFYRGQALAGYGLMWNTRYMQANKLPAPKEWADLDEAGLLRPRRRPRRRRARARRTSPSRRSCRAKAGTRAGSRSCRSPATAPRSPSAASACPTACNNGQFGIGLVIDFFGLAAKASGFPVEFVYPSVTAIVPANIAAHRRREEPRGRQALHAVHALGGRPAAAARPEDLAPAGAAGDLCQGAGRLSESVQRHDPGEGELRLRPLGVALLRGLVALRPDHHLPPQGAAGGDARRSTTPRSALATKRTPARAARRSDEARVAPRRSTQKQAKDKELLAVFQAQEEGRRQAAKTGRREDAARGRSWSRRTAHRSRTYAPRPSSCAGIRMRTTTPIAAPVTGASAPARAGAALGDRARASIAVFLLVPVVPVVQRRLHRVLEQRRRLHARRTSQRFFQHLAHARVVLEQPLRRRRCRCVFASLIAVPLAYFTVALPVPRRAPDPDARRAAADHAALRRRGGDAAASSGAPARSTCCSTTRSASRSRSWRG